MNRKFKLIKEYPGSPKLGCIIEEKEHYDYYPITESGGWFSEKKHLNSFPEFWEEIINIPVGTRIVDTYSETFGIIYTKLENGKWKCDDNIFTINEDYIGKDKRFNITEKEFLFKDHLGNNIYYNDSCYFIYKKNFLITTFLKHVNIAPPDDEWIIFKNEKDYEKYLIFNKPCLSLNDVAKVYVTANNYNPDKPLENQGQSKKLYHLVKSKLKL